MKKIIAVLILLFCNAVFAAPDFAKYFNDKSGCFILFDLNQNKVIAKYNPARCAKQISPNSTFKIPLSLMAFDQHLIDQTTVFKWDGKNTTFPLWNQDQTPQTWLKNSVVWVSQVLTPKLGIEKIKFYLHQFHYGNQDFSGGLTKAWLNSSLKISADEQLEFLKKLMTHKLPVSNQAMVDTIANLKLETLPQGWELYGKTGTGNLDGLQDGWFVGFVQKANQTFIFVLNFTDLENPKMSEFAGIRAKKITKDILVNDFNF